MHSHGAPRYLHPFPTRRSSDLPAVDAWSQSFVPGVAAQAPTRATTVNETVPNTTTTERDGRISCTSPDEGVPNRRLLRGRSEEHTSELQSHHDLVCRLLLEKKT